MLIRFSRMAAEQVAQKAADEPDPVVSCLIPAGFKAGDAASGAKEEDAEARSHDGPAAGDTDSEEDDVETSREPQVRGRAPIFENGQRSIASLISDVERGVIALPDLQFVWEDTKVRDLLDSLYRVPESVTRGRIPEGLRI